MHVFKDARHVPLNGNEEDRVYNSLDINGRQRTEDGHNMIYQTRISESVFFNLFFVVTDCG